MVPLSRRLSKVMKHFRQSDLLAQERDGKGLILSAGVERRNEYSWLVSWSTSRQGSLISAENLSMQTLWLSYVSSPNHE